MTAPIIPFSLTRVNTAQHYSRVVAGNKQSKPYDLRLAYRGFSKRRLQGSVSMTNAFASRGGVPLVLEDLNSASGDGYAGAWPVWRGLARNAAVARFNTLRGEKASMAVAMGEARESLTMITKRISQLLGAYSSLRRGDYYSVCEYLHLTSVKKPGKSLVARSKALVWLKHPRKRKFYAVPRDPATSRRKAADNISGSWLEYSFGWAPLIGDISTALRVLDAPLNYFNLTEGRGRYTNTWTLTDVVEDSTVKTTYKGVHKVEFNSTVSAVLTVQNPNRDLASRLGLTNLASAAVELWPFSFVLNWGVNLNEYLSQFDSFPGVSVSSAYYTDFLKSSAAYTITSLNKASGITTTLEDSMSEGFSVERTIGSLPSVSFGVRAAYRHNFSRALNQSALLVQLFAPKR